MRISAVRSAYALYLKLLKTTPRTSERKRAAAVVADAVSYIISATMRSGNVALSQSQRVAKGRWARRESEAVLRALAAAYERGFRNGMDAALFILANAEPPIPIEELARA